MSASGADGIPEFSTFIDFWNWEGSEAGADVKQMERVYDIFSRAIQHESSTQSDSEALDKLKKIIREEIGPGVISNLQRQNVKIDIKVYRTMKELINNQQGTVSEARPALDLFHELVAGLQASETTVTSALTSVVGEILEKAQKITVEALLEAVQANPDKGPLDKGQLNEALKDIREMREAEIVKRLSAKVGVLKGAERDNFGKDISRDRIATAVELLSSEDAINDLFREWANNDMGGKTRSVSQGLIDDLYDVLLGEGLDESFE